MHPSCWNFGRRRGRVGLMEDVEGLCLHIVHSTSSTPDPEISHRLTEEKLSSLAMSDCTAQRISWRIFGKVSPGWLTFVSHPGETSRVCFTLGVMLKRPVNMQVGPMVSPVCDFTNFTINFRIDFTMSKTLKTVLWKWAKTPLHLSLDPGNGRWVAMFERQL